MSFRKFRTLTTNFSRFWLTPKDRVTVCWAQTVILMPGERLGRNGFNFFRSKNFRRPAGERQNIQKAEAKGVLPLASE